MNKNRLRKRMGSILLLFMVIFNSCDSGVIDSTNDKLTENTIKKPQNSNEATNQSSNEAPNQNSNETTKMIEKIEFNDQELYLFLTDEGNSGLLTVTITPENATDKALIWTSFDEKVATVDESGRVTAVSAGKTLIAVKPKNGSGGEIYCDVIVYPNQQSGPDENNTQLEDILNFVLNDDGRSYSIEGAISDDEIAGEIRIPETYRGYPITSIQDTAFQDCRNLTKVVLPNSITSIGQGAFMTCSNLEEINIPAGVREIKRGIFSNCYNLERVSFQGDVLAIAPYAFDHCSSMEEIQLPDTIRIIGISAFNGCENLINVNIPHLLEAASPQTGEQIIRHQNEEDPMPPAVRNIYENAPAKIPFVFDINGQLDEDGYQEYYDNYVFPLLQ